MSSVIALVMLVVIIAVLAYIIANGGGPSSGDPMNPGVGGAL